MTIMTLLGSPVADREEFTGYADLFLSTEPAVPTSGSQRFRSML